MCHNTFKAQRLAAHGRPLGRPLQPLDERRGAPGSKRVVRREPMIGREASDHQVISEFLDIPGWEAISGVVCANLHPVGEPGDVL